MHGRRRHFHARQAPAGRREDEDVFVFVSNTGKCVGELQALVGFQIPQGVLVRDNASLVLGTWSCWSCSS